MQYYYTLTQELFKNIQMENHIYTKNSIHLCLDNVSTETLAKYEITYIELIEILTILYTRIATAPDTKTIFKFKTMPNNIVIASKYINTYLCNVKLIIKLLKDSAVRTMVSQEKYEKLCTEFAIRKAGNVDQQKYDEMEANFNTLLNKFKTADENLRKANQKVIEISNSLNEYKVENEDLSQDKLTLIEKVKNLKQKRANLLSARVSSDICKENTALKAQNQELASCRDNACNQYEELYKKWKELNNSYVGASENLVTIDIKNNELLKENDELKISHAAIAGTNLKLAEKIDELIDQVRAYDDLNASHTEIAGQNLELTSQIQAVIKENNELINAKDQHYNAYLCLRRRYERIVSLIKE